MKKRLLTRRNFFGLAASGIASAGAAGLYMKFTEAEWLQVIEHEVVMRSEDRSATELRLLHLSDFHASPEVGLDFISRAIDLGLSLKPDLICLTGDFITTTYAQFHEYGLVLRKLASAAPTFACIGNHDGGDWVRQWGYANWDHVGAMLKESGITVLHNAATIFEAKGAAIQLIGLGDLWAEEINPPMAFAHARPGYRTILLSHNPDSKEVLGQYDWNLMLSGHTHGGQFYLPFLGAPFAPVRDHRYLNGLKAWKDRWIHVSKGVGNLHGMQLQLPAGSEFAAARDLNGRGRIICWFP